MSDQLELVPFTADHTLVDGLRWHDGHLWGSDFVRREVIKIDEDGKVSVVAHVPGEPSGLGFLPDGTPLVVSQHDQSIYRIGPDGELSLHADVSSIAVKNANDMVVRSDGGIYVGSFGYSPPLGEAPRNVGLGYVSPTGEVSEAAADLHFPNGCVLTEGESTLLVAETFGRRITAFDVDVDGGLTNRRTWADLPTDAYPDGMCLDDMGALWMGTVSGERFLRLAEGGHVLAEIPTPGRWTISTVFGGHDRSTLYCSSTVTTMQDLAQGNATGFIDTVRPGQRGAGTP